MVACVSSHLLALTCLITSSCYYLSAGITLTTPVNILITSITASINVLAGDLKSTGVLLLWPHSI